MTGCLFLRSFSADIHTMTGRRPNIFWRACWLFISPLMLLVVFAAYVITQTDKHPNYPAWDPSSVRRPLFYTFMTSLLLCR